jgi:Flp pilus assembly protein TadG
MSTIGRRQTRQRRQRGQSLVEFSVVLIPFLFILMGVVDLGRGIYVYNSVSQAAREIARAASVHPCTGTGCADISDSTQTTAVKNTQKGLIPGLTDAGITSSCTDINDADVPLAECSGAYYVKVTVSVPFSVLTPLVSMVAPTTMTSTSHIQISTSRTN